LRVKGDGIKLDTVLLPEDGTSLSAETIMLSLQFDQFQPSEPEKPHVVDYLRKKKYFPIEVFLLLPEE